MTRIRPFQPLVMPRAAGWAAWVLLGAFGSGCVGFMVGAAGCVAGAVYVTGKLTEEFGYELSAVYGAAVNAMKELELPLSEDRADRLSAHLESEFADRTHVRINLESLADSRTRVSIRVGLVGDEDRSRKILMTIKQHLPPDRCISGNL
jgi:hypothetical protein